MCLLKDSKETAWMCGGKKVHEAVDKQRTMLNVTSGFFLVRNKTQHSQ